jgi:alkyldihydroxyacetonephosphate synthase
VLGLESLAAPLDGDADVALALCRDAGLRVVEAGSRGQAASSWRSSFVRAPYLRESLMLLGVLVETFETAVTWDRFEALVADVTAATEDALRRVCGGGTVTCRLTHVYPDGCAPYFTVLAPARRGSEVAQWDEVKAAASEALAAAGGTITHHHAVGRDHRPWYDGQRPDPFALALTGAKAAVDPVGVLNPGVLLPAAERGDR